MKTFHFNTSIDGRWAFLTKMMLSSSVLLTLTNSTCKSGLETIVLVSSKKIFIHKRSRLVLLMEFWASAHGVKDASVRFPGISSILRRSVYNSSHWSDWRGIARGAEKCVLFFVSSAGVKVQVYLCSCAQFIYVLFTLGSMDTVAVWDAVRGTCSQHWGCLSRAVLVSLTLTANTENRLKLTKKRRPAIIEVILDWQDWRVWRACLSLSLYLSFYLPIKLPFC